MVQTAKLSSVARFWRRLALAAPRFGGTGMRVDIFAEYGKRSFAEFAHWLADQFSLEDLFRIIKRYHLDPAGRFSHHSTRNSDRFTVACFIAERVKVRLEQGNVFMQS